MSVTSRTGWFLSCILFFAGCAPDIEKINALTKEVKLPTISDKDIEIIYNDSTKLKLILKAPLLNMYLDVEPEHYEAPYGMEVVFYDNNEKPESKVTCKYAIYYKDKQLWEGRDSVEAVNLQKGDTLQTDQLFWNQGTGIIYSEKFTRIATVDGVFYGEAGFESNQNFSRWKLFGSSGNVNVNEQTNETD